MSQVIQNPNSLAWNSGNNMLKDKELKTSKVGCTS